ncbi:NADH:ubiquinone oxidoreductase, membrane subunit M [Candidatus Zixiibacteriota bacterium]|nr:NADH:ubiquinone oxidoreductase, membrane subunit M [candidate division Zixibacteria bacterium]
MGIDILTLVTFFPLLGVLLLLFVPKERSDSIKAVAIIISFVTFLISVFLYVMFDPLGNGMQFEVNIPWIGAFGINYHLGIDGISLLLIMLTTLLSLIAIVSSWSAITKSIKGYYISMLLLETGMLGVFVALDLFLFYLFWEAMLIPMYFLIGVWGGPRKIYAAIKFVLFTMFGSLLMLVALIYLVIMYHGYSGEYSFDILKLYQMPIPLGAQTYIFLAFALAFAIKVPIWPFHTWLPDAHVEAPTAGSVILAGVLLKMGTYGFIRICLPMFPEATLQFVPLISVLAIIGIIYGALVAMVQRDVKSLVAFSSVSHLGFVMLGMMTLNIQGLEGSVIQMINHGISTGALFLLVGMIYERRHTRLISEFGGLAKSMPVFSTFFMIVALSSIGLPLTNGFVGEFLILLGTFKANQVYAILGATGVILAACYMLWMLQRVIFGKITQAVNENLHDLYRRERLVLIPLVLLILWIGIYPKPFFNRMEPAVRNVITLVNRARSTEAAGESKQKDLNAPGPKGVADLKIVGDLNE